MHPELPHIESFGRAREYVGFDSFNLLKPNGWNFQSNFTRSADSHERHLIRRHFSIISKLVHLENSNEMGIGQV